MPVQNIDVYIDYADSVTRVSLGDQLISIHIADGRQVGQWYDNPGRVVVKLRDTEGLITSDNAASFTGRPITIRGGSPEFSIWDGFVSHTEVSPDQDGDTSTVNVYAFSIDELITRGDIQGVNRRITLSPILNSAIPLPVSDFPRPSSVGVTDSHIWISDDDNDEVHSWSVVTKARDSRNDVDLSSARPVGVAFDGDYTMWIANAATSRVEPYDLRTVYVQETRSIPVYLSRSADSDTITSPELTGSLTLPDPGSNATISNVRATVETLSRIVPSEIRITTHAGAPFYSGRSSTSQSVVVNTEGTSGQTSTATVTVSGRDVSIAANIRDDVFTSHPFQVEVIEGPTQNTTRTYRDYVPTGWSNSPSGASLNDALKVTGLRAVVNIVYTLTFPGSPTLQSHGFVVSTPTETAVTGVAYHETDRRLFVCYSDSPLVTAWNTSSSARDMANDINGLASGASGFIDIAILDDQVYLLESSGRISVFNTGVYADEIDYFRDRNINVVGLRARSNRLYVLISGSNPRVEEYRLQIESVVAAPRQTTSRRAEELVRLATDQQLESVGSGTDLPGREWEGSLRDAIRRVMDSEYGRFIDGRLYARSSPRNNLANGEALGLRINRNNLYESEQVKLVDDWVINVIHAVTSDGVVQTIRDRQSVAQYGEKPLSVATDLGVTAARELGQLFLDKWRESVQIIDIYLDAFFESDRQASNMLGAAPHTVVDLSIGQTDGQYVVLSRDCRIFMADNAVRAVIKLRLIAASLWDIAVTTGLLSNQVTLDGVGVTLDGVAVTLGD